MNTSHVRITRPGGRGQDPTPLKNHKNICFLSNTGLDPLKITKLPSQHSMLGHHRHASKSYTGIWIIPPLIIIKTNEKQKQKTSELDPPDKTFWIRTCIRINTVGKGKIGSSDKTKQNNMILENYNLTPLDMYLLKTKRDLQRFFTLLF